MATSGSTSVAFTSWDTLKFSWSRTSYSVAANTSTISWKMELVATERGLIQSTAVKNWSVTVNGTTYSGTNKIGIGNNETLTLASGVTTISHNTDGTKTFNYSFYQQIKIDFSGSHISSAEGSGSGTLDTIPRTTTPTVSPTSVAMGSAVTISLPRKASSFTHDLAYSFMGGSYKTFATDIGTSYTWPTPDLATSIPNGVAAPLTIRCITKNGGTTVGTTTVTMSLRVPDTVVPTISSVKLVEATPDLAAQFGAFIQGKSQVTATITAAGAKGSTIKSYKSVFAGLTYTESSWTSPVVTTSGSLLLDVEVTDSRGRKAAYTTTVKILPYTLPAITAFKAYRVDSKGSSKDDGTYMGLTYTYSVASLNEKNTANMVIEYKLAASTSYDNTLATSSDRVGSAIRFFSSPTFPIDYQYDVRMTVTDWFGATAVYTATLPTADVVFDISADGKGLGIGKVSQRSNASEFGRPMYDRFDTLIGNGLAAYGSGDNAIDANLTEEHLVVTNKNTPTTAFWYVKTEFYSTKSNTANRVQYALPYQAIGSMYMRVYYNGAWTAWSVSPVLASEYDQGIWHVRRWTDGWVEMTGSYEITDMACTTALGNWYRTAVFTPSAFPLKLDDPMVTANYESAGYGALLWATTEAGQQSTPSYYLIRPTSATIATGRVQLRVTGRIA